MTLVTAPKLKAINLRPFGMLWDVDPTKFSAIPADFSKKISKVTTDDDKTFSTQLGNKYTKGNLIGSGSYGKVYECVREKDNVPMVMKILTGGSLYSLIKEAIIQIIIVETTKDITEPSLKLKGPFAPVLYEIGYKEAGAECYIFSEKMRQTTHALIQSRKDYADYMRADLYHAITQISFILDTLGKLLKFNHRDFKTDNCMYMRDADGIMQIRLIDFGFSCIQFGNMQIDGGGGGQWRHCTLPTRDLTQYLYEIYKYHPYVPYDLKSVLEKLLTFPKGGKPCYIYKGCTGIREWKDIYRYLNDDQVVNPNGTPEVVTRVLKAYASGGSVDDALAYKPDTKGRTYAKTSDCPADKPERNPVTRKCVKACPPGTKRNPDFFKQRTRGPVRTRRVRPCILDAPSAQPKVVKAVAPCPAEKPDRNPKTGRCLKPCWFGYKRDAAFVCRSMRAAAARAKAAKAVAPCPAAKPDRNPKTGRCLTACKPGYKRDAAFVCRSTRKMGRPKKA